MSSLRGPIDVVRSWGLTIVAARYGPNFRPRACALVWTLATVAWALTTSPVPAADVKVVRETLSLVDRTVTQDQGAWIIDYRLRHTGETGVIVTPEEIAVKVEGWVSNSRVASHAMPRWSSLVVTRGPDLSTTSEVIAAVDESHRCRERLMVSVWTEDQHPTAVLCSDEPDARIKTTQTATMTPIEAPVLLPLSLSPGSIVRVPPSSGASAYSLR